MFHKADCNQNLILVSGSKSLWGKVRERGGRGGVFSGGLFLYPCLHPPSAAVLFSLSLSGTWRPDSSPLRRKNFLLMKPRAFKTLPNENNKPSQNPQPLHTHPSCSPGESEGERGLCCFCPRFALAVSLWCHLDWVVCLLMSLLAAPWLLS